MPNEQQTAAELRKTKQKHRNPQLRVVFDSDALYVSPTNLGSASDLVRKEISDLITDARYPDLDILWYLPEVVRHERQHQMQTEALKLRSAINRIERLLDHNLALADQFLTDHVERKINETEKTLGLREIKLDHGKVDWIALIHAACYRLPPFSPGETEKGFRDAIVAESFLQLVGESPKTPYRCRIVLVTLDELLTEAVNKRISGLPNVSVLRGVDELKGLINALVSDVDEEFIVGLKPKAARLFFTSSDNKDALFYRENIEAKVREKFKSELAARPEGTTFRSDRTWTINYPTFARKEGKRTFWTSRIDIDVEAGNTTLERETMSTAGLSSQQFSMGQDAGVLAKAVDLYSGSNLVTGEHLLSPSAFFSLSYPPGKRVVTQRGKDVYEVLWSVEVTVARNLRKEQIDDIKHIGINWQAVS
jgi:hypothetical protein